MVCGSAAAHEVRTAASEKKSNAEETNILFCDFFVTSLCWRVCGPSTKFNDSRKCALHKRDVCMVYELRDTWRILGGQLIDCFQVMDEVARRKAKNRLFAINAPTHRKKRGLPLTQEASFPWNFFRNRLSSLIRGANQTAEINAMFLKTGLEKLTPTRKTRPSHLLNRAHIIFGKACSGETFKTVNRHVHRARQQNKRNERSKVYNNKEIKVKTVWLFTMA